MSALSKQYHSLIIEDDDSSRNTWDYWHLIPTSRPVVNPPEPIQNLVQIPGRDGFVDLTNLITGRPIYGQRTGSWEFIAHPNFTDSEPWDVKFSQIMQYCHNKFRRIILEDNPNYYYEGRLKVNQWKSDRNWSLVTIDYTLDPYKRAVFSSEEPWLWDPFDFTDGYITNDWYRDIAVSVSKTIVITNTSASTAGSEPFIPEIEASVSGGSMSVKFSQDGPVDDDNPDIVSYPIHSGVNVISDMIVTEPRMWLKFTGTGIVTIRYRSGWL